MSESKETNSATVHEIVDELAQNLFKATSNDTVSRHYSLQASIDQNFSLDISAEEVLTRRSLVYLGGRRWGLAREEREKLRVLLDADNSNSLVADILAVYADLLEGQIERAEALYTKLMSNLDYESDSLFFSDIYLLSAYISLVSENIEMFSVPEDFLSTSTWIRSQTSRVIYNALHQKSRHFLGELGTMADSMIQVPGTKRINAVWLRALQGKFLIFRGDFEWAERVLSYTLNRAEILVNWNEPLKQSIQKNLEIAQLGVQNLSVK